jgi:hypothetical protein
MTAPNEQMTTETEQKPVLWCVNIHGPDDVIAVASYLDAVKMANAFNAWWLAMREKKPLHEQYDARMWAVPLEWPYSAEIHTEAVASSSDEYDWLREIARRSVASAEPAVAVKALEWREYPNEYYPDVFGHCWDADTPFGRYEISEASASDSPYYNVCFGTSFVADKDGLPEAEAAAQADYEQRVRSALASPPPSPQAFVLEMNKCVEQANENATRAEENAARAERLEKELQMLRCKVSASPPPSPVVSEEMVKPTPWTVGKTYREADRHKEIMRLMREDFDPTPAGWEGREWNDNAEDVATKIAALFAPAGEYRPVEIRNNEAGFVEFVNADVPFIVREIDGPVAILLDMETRNVIGYRVYDHAPAAETTVGKTQAIDPHKDAGCGAERREDQPTVAPDAGWRTMESAPKDGTVIMVACDVGEPWGWVRGVSRWDGAAGIYGWLSRGFFDPPGDLGLGSPTRWMPLPASPTGGDK